MPILSFEECLGKIREICETEPISPNVLNFLELNDIQEQELKEQIEKYDGEVGVWVHPYFYCYFDKDFKIIFSDEYHKEISIKVDEEIKKQLLEPSKPTFLFIENESVYRTSVYLSKYNNSFQNSNKAYIVPTINGSPCPLAIENTPTTMLCRNGIGLGLEVENWIKLLNSFHNLKTKKINLAGFDLMLDKKEEFEKLYPERVLMYAELFKQFQKAGIEINDYPALCVGTAAAFFSNYFQVEFSDLTSPHGLKMLTK